jgi:hypothetical protein
MPAELRLVLAGKEVRLTFTIDDREVNGELWSFDRKLSKAEVQEIVECVFHDAYSVVQHAAHE